MRHPAIRTLHAYWARLSGHRTAPERSEIDPAAIAGQLGDILLMEGARADFRIRYAGSRVVDILGMGVTGYAFESIWSETARDPIRQALAAAEDAAPTLIGFAARDSAPGDSGDTAERWPRANWPNRRDIEAFAHPDRRAAKNGGEAILLPLSHRGRIGERILGAVALFRHPSLPRETPTRLEMSGMRYLAQASLPGRGTGLMPSAVADTVIDRRGHLVVMRGFRDGE